MADLPAAAVRYPLARTVRVPGDVVSFLDGSEQRWQTAGTLDGIRVSLTGIPAAEVTALVSWFDGVLGARYGFDAPLGSGAIEDLALESDELAVTETEPGRYSVAFAARQTTPGTWGAVAAVYPGIASGARVAQRPWTAKRRFLTQRNDLESGARYASAERATAKLAWSLTYPAITVAEMLAILALYVSVGGRAGTFSFTDPDGVAHASCRFDMDAFEGTYVAAGHCSCGVEIVEV